MIVAVAACTTPEPRIRSIAPPSPHPGAAILDLRGLERMDADIDGVPASETSLLSPGSHRIDLSLDAVHEQSDRCRAWSIGTGSGFADLICTIASKAAGRKRVCFRLIAVAESGKVYQLRGANAGPVAFDAGNGMVVARAAPLSCAEFDRQRMIGTRRRQP